MNIAIDYDGTYTADPLLWGRFIADAELLGHKVYCVTQRRQTEMANMVIPEVPKHRIICADMGSKIYAADSIKLKIDVWIDDDPRSLVHGK